MPTATANTRKRDKRSIPVAKQDAILEARWAGKSERATAAEVGVDAKTVRGYWNAHLDEIAADRAADLERARAQIVGRLWRNANDARRRLADSEEPEKLLNVERQALSALAKAHGMDQLTVTHHDAPRIPTQAEAEEALTKLHRVPASRN